MILNYASKFNGQIKTITFKKEDSPFRYGLGYYTDINNIEWDISCIIGNKINARPVNYNEEYYSTQANSNDSGLREWLTYNVKLI